MSNSIVGALRIAVGLDSAAFEAGVDKTKRSVDKLGKSAGDVGAAWKHSFADMEASWARLGGVLAATIGGLGVGAIAALGKSTLDFADDLATAADQAGVSVERFQTLKQVFRTLEIDAASFDKAMLRLVTTLGEVQSGVQNSATKALEKMGITARVLSGEITTTDQLLDAIADSSKRFGTEAQFTAAVVDIFGKRAGPQLAAAMRQGSEGIKQMEVDVREFGTVLTEQQINKLADANEAIERWQETGSYHFAIFAANAINSLEEASGAFDRFLVKRRAAEGDGGFFKGLAGKRTIKTPDRRVLTNPANGRDVNRALGFDITSPRPERAPLTAPASGGGGGGTRRRPAGGRASGSAKKEVSDFAGAMAEMSRRVEEARLQYDAMAMSLGEIDLIDARLRTEALRVEQEKGVKWTEAQRAEYRAAAKDLRLWSIEAERITQVQAEIVAFDPTKFVDGTVMQKLAATLSSMPDLAKNQFGLPMLEVFGQVSGGVATAIDAMQNSLAGFAVSLKKMDIVGIIGNLANLIGSVVGTIQGFKTGFGTNTTPPGRAAGGPVTGGRPYLIGERGPEIFMPNTSGSVIPNNKVRAAGGTVVQRFDLRGAVMTSDLLQQMNRIGEQAVVKGAALGSSGALKRIARLQDRRLG